MRWTLAEEEAAQGALFPDENVLGHHVGRGEFTGMEFLHVNAKQLINHVGNAGGMPFEWTVNAYRGCSHACSYCADGDTQVLMADGRTRALADLRAGDRIAGTARRGAEIVETEVIDHWSSTRRGLRITVAGGRSLVTSGDHRLLTEAGWRRVDDLSTDRSLIAPDGDALRIACIEELGHAVPMFDITTGTGDFVANGVVSHNCFARPTHDYLGLNVGDDFDRKIVVKINAVERLRAELARPSWTGDAIAMGTNTDPYQRCEGKYHLTRGLIEVLGAAGNPFSILTKSTLILRDIDVLTAAAARTSVRLAFSIGTLDETVWRRSEPGTPHPRQRVAAVAKLTEAGFDVGVLVAPVLPGLSDRPEQLEAVARACVDAGATSLTAIPLHLRTGVRSHFMAWLADAFPDHVAQYQSLFGDRAYQPKAVGATVSGQVARAQAAAVAHRSATEPAKPVRMGRSGRSPA